MDLFSIATGAAGVGAAYFLYLSSSKGLPVALCWVKARWNSGTGDIESLKGDLGATQRKIAAFDTNVRAGFAAVYAEIDEINAKLGLPTPAAPALNVTQSAPTAPQPPAFLREQA